MERPREVSPSRRAVFEALKIAAPGAFNDEMRRSFLAEGTNIVLAEIDMDSLGEMEFCIAVERSTGVTLLPPQLKALASTDAIEHCIREQLEAAKRSAG
jgi:hypothetical protein